MHTREQHIAMMKDPDKWPIWPHLPLIHDDTRAMAFMYNPSLEGNSRPAIVLGTFIVMAPRLRDPEVVEFVDHAAIYDAGWRVD